MAYTCSRRHVPAGTAKRPTRTSRSALRTTSGATLYRRCASYELTDGSGRDLVMNLGSKDGSRAATQ